MSPGLLQTLIELADFVDVAVTDGDVRALGGRACSVDHRAVAQQDVVGLGVRDGQTKQGKSGHSSIDFQAASS